LEHTFYPKSVSRKTGGAAVFRNAAGWGPMQYGFRLEFS
jgi:hypothetical protein